MSYRSRRLPNGSQKDTLGDQKSKNTDISVELLALVYQVCA
jgi:hypothetical protein